MDYKKRLEELKNTLKYFEAQANATQGAIQLLQEIIAEEDADDGNGNGKSGKKAWRTICQEIDLQSESQGNSGQTG